MKLCILIGSAEHQFFQKGSVMLQKCYNNFSEESIEIWSYRGGGSDGITIIDNTIMVPEDPREYGLCFIRALEWVIKERKPDIICKTNTSLVLNIPNLLDFVNQSFYNMDLFYGYGIYYTQTTHPFPYIPGFFWLFSKDIAQIFINNFDNTYNKILPLWTSGDLIIPGAIPDDILITDIIGSFNIWRMDIPEKIMSIYPFFKDIPPDFKNIEECNFEKYIAIRTRMPGIDYDDRYRLELPLTLLIANHLNKLKS